MAPRAAAAGPDRRAERENVDYDFLAILLDDLAARGARYQRREGPEESDVEGPAFAEPRRAIRPARTCG